ncbi:MAG: hypothetical protein ACI9LU_003040 [Polaribacter sp.]|jgi:hypothetical protein
MSYQKQVIDFRALVAEDLERFQPLFDKAGLSFTFNDHVKVQAEDVLNPVTVKPVALA